NERGNGMAMRAIVGVIADIPVDEVRRTHQAIRSNAGLAGKVVKHEDALTQAVGAYLEAGSVGGKRVVTAEPFARIVWFGVVGVVLTVVEDHFEHPVGLLQHRLGQKAWPEPLSGQQ